MMSDNLENPMERVKTRLEAAIKANRSALKQSAAKEQYELGYVAALRHALHVVRNEEIHQALLDMDKGIMDKYGPENAYVEPGVESILDRMTDRALRMVHEANPDRSLHAFPEDPVSALVRRTNEQEAGR